MSNSFKPNNKYQSYPKVDLPDRSWPNNSITKAPIWCSVDLRDGNQALIDPMNLDQKLEMFTLLTEIGFKEIEVGFPSASEIEFSFVRTLLNQNLISDDLKPQVLTQAREHLIDKTFDSIKGYKQAIVHLYNSTSTLQRRVVFKKDKKDIIKLAVDGTKQIKELAAKTDTKIFLEYSPESFTGTELDFALEICEAVYDIWQPSKEKPLILNLPATVEMSTPNIYADQIEWFLKHFKDRESIILSLHTHNDRGTAVAATELALMAGADRVEGTLFGNGERTGNVDLITLALNMYTHGVDPNLDINNINHIKHISDKCTNIPVSFRHPYAGELVFTAFSGSHQDAISKGMKEIKKNKQELWEVPYIPVDPSDIGRTYQAIIRINSQSGKGGVAYILEQEHGIPMPKSMHPDFSAVIQEISEQKGREVKTKEIWEAFENEYLNSCNKFEFIKFKSSDDEGRVNCELTIKKDNKEKFLSGTGNGPIDACKNALENIISESFKITHYSERSINGGDSDARAISFIEVSNINNDQKKFGVGIDSNITIASIKSLISAVNRL